MAGDSATLSLDGNVDLATFTAALERFRMLLDELGAVLAVGYEIDWEITALRSGSAITAVRGTADSRDAVLAVTTALDIVGEALQSRTTIPYGADVEMAASNLARLANGRIRAVRLATAGGEYTLAGHSMGESEAPRPVEPSTALADPVAAFGAVEGTIRTLSNRGKPRFTLYDDLDDRVTCYLEENQQDEVAGLWGSRVVVEGWVQRDGSSGRPRSIRRITAITPTSEREPLSWQDARGSIPRGPAALRAEDAIRGLRDA